MKLIENITVPRFSFGVRVIRSGMRDWAFCDRCGKPVRMNGPGSDASRFANLLHSALDKLLPEVQLRFWAAADRHDMDCHYGQDDRGLDLVNKDFRRNCLLSIHLFYSPLQKSLSDSLREAGGPASFWEALFSSDACARWGMYKELRQLLKDRKDEETWAELYYTALDVGSRSLVHSAPCTSKERENERE